MKWPEHAQAAAPVVVGGRGIDGTVELDSVELYDPKKNRWQDGPKLSKGRSGHTATLLADRVAAENMDLWVRGLWRAAVSCVAITMLLGAWAVLNPAMTAAPSDDLSLTFENTLLASVDQNDPAQ